MKPRIRHDSGPVARLDPELPQIIRTQRPVPLAARKHPLPGRRFGKAVQQRPRRLAKQNVPRSRLRIRQGKRSGMTSLQRRRRIFPGLHPVSRSSGGDGRSRRRRRNGGREPRRSLNPRAAPSTAAAGRDSHRDSSAPVARDTGRFGNRRANRHGSATMPAIRPWPPQARIWASPRLAAVAPPPSPMRALLRNTPALLAARTKRRLHNGFHRPSA